MKCPSCGEEIPIDLIEHIRTRCTGKAKEDPKQVPLWPPNYISIEERSNNVQNNNRTTNGRTRSA